MGIPISDNLADLFRDVAEAAVTYAYPRWLKLKQAAHYSGIGQKRLITLAESGSIVGFQDPDSGRGDWIFDRASIDAYRLAQAPGDVQAKAQTLLNGGRL